MMAERFSCLIDPTLPIRLSVYRHPFFNLLDRADSIYSRKRTEIRA